IPAGEIGHGLMACADARVGEDGSIEFRGSAGLAFVEPKAGGHLVAGHISISLTLGRRARTLRPTGLLRSRCTLRLEPGAGPCGSWRPWIRLFGWPRRSTGLGYSSASADVVRTSYRQGRRSAVRDGRRSDTRPVRPST